jgi:hypothetical protein
MILTTEFIIASNSEHAVSSLLKTFLLVPILRNIGV